jgi:diguanylate cyclase (GGDEF)-like protein
VLLDLNGFKNVNDTLGHAAGDQLLLEIGTRLADSVRATDCVARLGGDEFVVLLDRLEGDIDSDRLAASLVERVSIPVTIDGLRLAVEGSAGVAIFPDDALTVDSLLRCADVAMYEAKRRGDSIVRYDPSQDLASPERLGLLADLQSALDADDQLHLHFQPQLDLRTGLPGNVEALVRWKHPTRGNLSPAEFVPVIEHSALIGPFTAKVLDEAVRCCVAWQTDASLHGVGVAVNLSARNLMHRDLPDEVARILARHGLPARKLVLEITETAAMNDTEICESVLGRLRDLGIRLSVDDFGTGYASLTFLRRIDVAEVKLDRAFVADMLEDEAAATIVGATVALAHGLGLTVVAEGVETADQLAALHLAGCDLAQGYFLSKPVPPNLLSDGAESAVAKAAAEGVIEPTSRQPLPPRLPVPARRTPLARDLHR